MFKSRRCEALTIILLSLFYLGSHILTAEHLGAFLHSLELGLISLRILGRVLLITKIKYIEKSSDELKSNINTTLYLIICIYVYMYRSCIEVC